MNGYAPPRRYIQVGSAIFPKRNCVEVGDLILIASGAPCFMNCENQTVVIEDTSVEYAHMREFAGINGIGQMFNGRWQKVQWRNVVTDVTGVCYGWQVLDAEKT